MKAKTTVITIISTLILIALVNGCAQTEPQAVSESPLTIPVDYNTPVTQTQDIPSPIQTPFSDAAHSPDANIKIFNEFSDEDEGFFFLGMTIDDVVSVLKENNISYGTQDDKFIDFIVNDVGYILGFDKRNKALESAEIRRPKPIKGTSSQNLLYIGDTYTKMVELYGSNYTVSSTEDDEYQIYTYQFGEYYFQIWFQDDLISLLKVTDTGELPVDESPSKMMTIGEGGAFYLGQSYDDVIAKLEELGIEDIHKIEITNNPDEWNWDHTIISANWVSFTIDEAVYTINASSNSGVPTNEGLLAGNSLDKMKELYGTDYITYAYRDNGTVYEYKMGDYYFQVFDYYDSNCVYDWSISLYKYDK